jgi:hypothetical protein
MNASEIKEHIADIIAIARAIKKDAGRQTAEATKDDLRCLESRVRIAIDAIK